MPVADGVLSEFCGLGQPLGFGFIEEELLSCASPALAAIFAVCMCKLFVYPIITSGLPRSGELRTQKLKSHLVRT